MRITIRALCQKRNELHVKILHCRSELSKIFPVALVKSIRAKIQDACSKIFYHLHQIKAQKLDQLIGHQKNSDSLPESLKTAIRIPENLPLSDSEKSVLSKSLNFVPISEKSTNFQSSKTLKNSLPAFKWKSFFHDKEDNSNTLNKDTFETLQIRKSKWTPTEGQFASLDFFIKKYRHDIKRLKFNRNTKFPTFLPLFMPKLTKISLSSMKTLWKTLRTIF